MSKEQSGFVAEGQLPPDESREPETLDLDRMHLWNGDYCMVCGIPQEEYPRRSYGCIPRDKFGIAFEAWHEMNEAQERFDALRTEFAPVQKMNEELREEAKKLGLIIQGEDEKEAQRFARLRLHKAANGLRKPHWSAGPQSGTVQHIEWAALFAGADFACVVEAKNEPGQVVAYVQAPACFEKVMIAVKSAAPAGICIHVVPALPSLFTFVRERKARTLLEKIRAYFGARFTEVVKLELAG